MGDATIAFQVLRFIGFWQPQPSPSAVKRLAYQSYTIFNFLLILTFVLTEIMDIVLLAETIQDVIGNVFILLTIVSMFCRMINVLKNRQDIVKLIRTLTEYPYKSTDKGEGLLQARCDGIVRRNTIIYGSCLSASVLFTITDSVLRDVKDKRLMYRAWYPCDYTSPPMYWVVYTHQVLALSIGSILLISTDCIIHGLMQQVCCQIEILKYRLNNVVSTADQNASLRKCTYHHGRIYQFAALLNDVFNLSISVQFCTTAVIICTILYQMLQCKLFGREFFTLLSYVSCMLCEIFIYCWHANEITLKSIDLINTVFDMDWVSLNAKMRKSLIMIMRRTTTPIVLTSTNIIVLNLNSFVNLVKVSYSVFNVLQQAQQN